jgi:hypothetical protein
LCLKGVPQVKVIIICVETRAFEFTTSVCLLGKGERN